MEASSTLFEEIKGRMRNFRSDVFKPDGSAHFSPASGTAIFNATDLSRLSLDELQELGSSLIEMTFNEREAMYLFPCHLDYWSFAYAVSVIKSVAGSRPTPQGDGEYDDFWVYDANPIGLLLESVLSPKGPRGTKSIGNYLYRFVLGEIRGSYSLVLLPAFAYLEGLAKRLCSEYVAPDGRVLQIFSVHRPPIRAKQYDGTRPISSLSDLLYLLEQQCVSGNAQTVLLKCFEKVGPDTLYKWRNTALHGDKSSAGPLITVFCLISILMLELVRRRDDYESRLVSLSWHLKQMPLIDQYTS